MRNIEKIAQLNDLLRQTMLTGRVVMTNGVQQLPQLTRQRVISRVQSFIDFNEGNNPHGERDFGAFDEGEECYFWKIDYYDSNLEFLSPDPSNPEITQRVLTIMRADEY